MQLVMLLSMWSILYDGPYYTDLPYCGLCAVQMYHWADEALATVLCLLMVTTYGNATRRCYSCSDCVTVSDAHRQHAASCPRVCMIKVYLKEGLYAFLLLRPSGAVAKYCNDYVSLSVCLSVREDIRNHTCDLYQVFVPVACVCGSVLLRHVYHRPHHLPPGRGFLPH